MSDRLTVDTITSDALDALYDERDALRQVLHLLRYGMARAKDAQLAAAYVVEVIDSTTEMVTGRALEPCDRDQQSARAERAEAAIARVRLIKKAPGRSPYNTHSNAQDDGWDQALDAVHEALGEPERCQPKSAGKDHPIHELLEALKRGVPHPAPTDLVGRYYRAIHAECCPYDHTEPRPGYAAAANRAALAKPACACTYGERCPNCRD